MKKLLLLLLSMLMMFSLVACGEEEDKDDKEDTKVEENEDKDSDDKDSDDEDSDDEDDKKSEDDKDEDSDDEDDKKSEDDEDDKKSEDDEDEVTVIIGSPEVPKNIIVISQISGMGIIAIYTTIVMSIYGVIKSEYNGISESIMFNNLPNCLKLLQMCDDIIIARQNGNLKLEKYLTEELFNVYRNPLELIEKTKEDWYIDESDQIVNRYS